MKRSISFLFILILLYSLASCQPTKDSLSIDIVLTASPSPGHTPTTTPISKPTATPFVPLTLQEVELKLEEMTGDEVVYSEKIAINEDEYYFIGEKGDYIVNRDTGNIKTFVSNIYDTGPYEPLDEDSAKQLAIETLLKYCPEFFEYDYLLETIKHHETEFGFYFYQLSKKGRRTGNMVNAVVMDRGVVRAFSLSCNENPEEVDKDYTITEKEAVEAIYHKAQESIVIVQRGDEQTIEQVYDLDNRKDHTTEAYITCSDGIVIWQVKISNIKAIYPQHNLEYKTFNGIVDANTGEVLLIS